MGPMDQLPENLKIRFAKPEDHPNIIRVMKNWWGGRDLVFGLPRLFLDHFHHTSFVAERHEELVGFLIGFLSPSKPDHGYIHFSGVHPDCRKTGLGRHLYERFYALCRKDGRAIVRACTSPVNRTSIGFHTKLGFRILPGNGEVDGTPVTLNYNRPGDHKVVFELRLPLETR